MFWLLARPEWHARAACRGMNPSVFFPERNESSEPARAICDACPVHDECGEAGRSESDGVWGGRIRPSRRRRRRVLEVVR